MLETTSRWGSRVEFSAMTAKTTSPWMRCLAPSLREMILQRGGKIELTRTRFCEAIPASRRASSYEVKRSLCLPTPLVKKSFFGTMLFPNFYVPSVRLAVLDIVGRSRMSLSHLDGFKQNGLRFNPTFTFRRSEEARRRLDSARSRLFLPARNFSPGAEFQSL